MGSSLTATSLGCIKSIRYFNKTIMKILTYSLTILIIGSITIFPQNYSIKVLYPNIQDTIYVLFD
jgi:hypothetical protein